MRVRSGQFNKSARTTKPVGSGSVSLSLNSKVFDAGQALGFQPRVGQTLLLGWGSGHMPIAAAIDAMLDLSFQINVQGPKMPNLGACQAQLFPVAHAHAAPQLPVQLQDQSVILADAKISRPTPKVLRWFALPIIHTHPSCGSGFPDLVLDVIQGFIAAACLAALQRVAPAEERSP